MRLFLYSCIFLFPLQNLWGQKPDVRLIDKVNTSQADKVSIKGVGFGTDMTKIKVFFGGAPGVVTSVADQLIEAEAPAGATYDVVSATNIASGLSGYTRESFLLSFSGTHGFSPSNLEAQFDTFTENGLYDFCLCDFNLDNKLDVIAVNNSSNFISLLKNTSAIGTLSFTKAAINIGTPSIHARCGDLNGDGLPDFVVSEGGSGSRIFVYKNLGAYTFSQQVITFPGKQTKRIEIADLDMNGKPELIISDQANPALIVLANQSTLAAISFAAPLIIPVTGALSTDGLSVKDLDGDHRPDVVTTQFLSTTGNVFLLKNESVPGNIKLTGPSTLAVAGALVNVQVGDLDGDARPEIAATQLLASSVSIFRNQSSGTISFAPPQNILTDDRPWGIDFGDLDGDGKAEVVVASITKKSITVLNNESTPGNLSFQQSMVTTSYINRHIRLADADGDGKPDVVFASVDDNNLGIPASKVSVMRNKACMVPRVTPPGPLTICSGFTLRLNATVGGATTYDWKQGAATVYTGPNSFYDVTASGQYTVIATSEGGSCIKTSNAVDVTVVAAAPLGPAAPTNDGPACKGGTLQLSVADVGATTYQWTGPQGYAAAGLTPTPVSNFTIANTGKYNLDVLVGGCLAQQASTTVTMIDIPAFRVNVPGSDLVCAGQTSTLSMVPSPADFTYQWFEKTSGALTGETTSSLIVSTTGNYYAQMQSITYPACPAVKSDTAAIQVVSLPVASFNANATDCVNRAIPFTDQSVTDNSTTAFYDWNFGDGATATVQNPNHTFGTVNTFNVQLTVSYLGGICPSSFSKSISIQAPPSLSILSAGNIFSVCEGDSLQLSASGSFAAYLWSTLETTPSIFVKQAGSYALQVTDLNQCTATATQAVNALDAPEVTITAEPPQIDLGGSSQLTASGIDSYQWSPGETLSDSTIFNPVATPQITITYSVKGSSGNGCMGVGSIELKVKGLALVDQLGPSNFFSPNGDATNNYWEVKNIQNLPQCGINIYDDKGIKVYTAKPYLNTWDGTFNGKPLPDGVYYYIIRCDGEESNPKTGSITLIR